MIDVLVIGLIIVALMVYASTKIKRVTTEAFEAEMIETDDFSFVKPAEFLNKVVPGKGLLLEGYSREFGVGDAANIRQATYELKRVASTLDTAAAAVTASNRMVSDTPEIIGERKYRVIEIARVDKSIEFLDGYKLSESHGDVLQLHVMRLRHADNEVVARAETMLAGFIVK